MTNEGMSCENKVMLKLPDIKKQHSLATCFITQKSARFVTQAMYGIHRHQQGIGEQPCAQKTIFDFMYSQERFCQASLLISTIYFQKHDILY